MEDTDQHVDGPFYGIFPVPSVVGTPWQWCTVGELRFELMYAGSGYVLKVPAGFLTDLASIPRWLQWLVNPYDPQTAAAAIIHDALLAMQCEQRVAVGEFYHALTVAGFPRWKRVMFFLAVLAFTEGW